MPRIRFAPLLAAVAALAAGAASPAAAWEEPRNRLVVEVESESGEDLTFTLGGGFFGRLLGAVLEESMDCERSDTDPDMRRLLLHLEHHGEGARGVVRDRDGDVVVGVRRAGRLTLDVHDAGGERSEVVLPWAVAACMLGRDVDVADLFTGSNFELRVRDGEESVKVRVAAD